jgi:hypothetical protein
MVRSMTSIFAVIFTAIQGLYDSACVWPETHPIRKLRRFRTFTTLLQLVFPAGTEVGKEPQMGTPTLNVSVQARQA